MRRQASRTRRSTRSRWSSSPATCRRTTTAAIPTRRSTSTRTPTSSRSSGRSASASIASTASRICRGSWSARSTWRRRAARPRPRRCADGHLLRRSGDRRVPPGAGRDGAPDRGCGDRRADRRRTRVGRAPDPVRRRRRALGASHLGVGGACRSTRSPRRAHTDGQGVSARRSPAASRPDRLLGDTDLERQMPNRGCDRGGRHPSRGKRTRARGIRALRSRFRRRG